MSRKKYKVGDKVKVVKNISLHQFEIGEIVSVFSVELENGRTTTDKDAEGFIFSCSDDNDWWWMDNEEVEPVSEDEINIENENKNENMSKNLLTPEVENIVLIQRAALFALMANTFQMANAGKSAREIATMSAGILAKLIDGGNMVKDRIEHEVAGMSLKFLHTEQAIIETENILKENK